MSRRSREEAWIRGRLGAPVDRFEYIFCPDQQVFLAFAENTKADESRRRSTMQRLAYPVARLYPDGRKIRVPWTIESLTRYCAKKLRRLERTYGGLWRVVIQERMISG